MAYSTQRAVSDGTLTNLNVSIGYLKQADIQVFYDDLPADDTTWSWVGSTSVINFSPAIADGVEVLLKRTTKINEVINLFTSGASFTNAALDTNAKQQLYLNQEAVEGAALTDVFSDIDFHGYRIRNLGQATLPTDAVTLGQYQEEVGQYVADATAQANIATAQAVIAEGEADDAAASAAEAAISAAAAAATVAPAIVAAPTKSTPVDLDSLPIVDSADSNALKRVTWSNVKATLKFYFDTLYATSAALTGKASTGTNADITSMTALTSINILPGYLFGCTMSTAGSSATMSIAAGKAQDSTGVQLMALTAIAKTTSAWAVGTAAGGLDTGAIANNTWYHFFVIRRPDTGVVDVLFSLSATAPTLPTNYTQFRRIGAGRTNGSGQWTLFRQNGDKFDWSTPVLDVNISAVAASGLTTLTVPTGVKVQPTLQVSVGCSGASPNTGVYAVIGNADDATSAVEVVSTMNASNNSQATAQASGFTTDTSARLYFGLINAGVPSLATSPVGGAAAPACIVRTRGWTDTRGRGT